TCRAGSRWRSGASLGCSRGRSTRSPCSSTICNGWMQQPSTSLSIWLRIRRCSTCCWSELIGTTRSAPRTRFCGRCRRSVRLMRGCMRSCWRRLSSTMLDGSSDALHCEPERARPLAELVQEKTAGNPFFAIQFFIALVDEGLLAFDPVATAWQWNIDRIRAKSYADNVVDLMAGEVNRLCAGTQETLKQLACLGNVAEIAALTLVHGET